MMRNHLGRGIRQAVFFSKRNIIQEQTSSFFQNEFKFQHKFHSHQSFSMSTLLREGFIQNSFLKGSIVPVQANITLNSSPSSSFSPSCSSTYLFPIRSYSGEDRGKILTFEPLSTPSPPLPPPPPPLPPVVYVGPFSSTLRAVKLLSLSTCLLSLTVGPLMTFFSIEPGVNVFIKGTIASLMVLFSASTTVGLHWFTSPYIHKLVWIPGSKEVEVKMLSWMATNLQKTFKLSEVRHAETLRPLVTFEAEGSFYFVDKDHFPDTELLEKLSPKGE